MQHQFFRFSIFFITFLWSTGLLATHDTLQVCWGSSVQLQATTGNSTYRWWPTQGLSNPTIPDPIAVPQFTTTYIVESISALDTNLIINGDFEAGNTGFTSEYVYSPGANPTQGVYGVFNNANELSPSFFQNCKDHTTGSGALMVVDGSPIADLEVWCQTITVEPNKRYAFSTWLSTVLRQNPAALRFSINEEQIGETFTATIETCEWRQFYATWESRQNTVANICIVNRNIGINGNDFALDDFAFFEIKDPVYDTITVVVNNSVLTVIDTSFCADEMIDYQGDLIPVSPLFSLNYISEAGCDSVVQYQAEIIDTVTIVNRVDTLCPGEVLFFYDHLINQDTFLCETVNTANGCDTTYCLQAVFLTESAIGIQIQTPACFGDENGRIEVDVEAGLAPFDYQWEDGSKGPNRPNLKAGNYEVGVTDAKGCMASKQIVVTEPSLLITNISSSSNFCNGAINGLLSFETSGGTSPYQYSINAGQSFSSNSQFAGLSPGDFSTVVMDANQCMVSTIENVPQALSITLEVPPDQQINLGEALPVMLRDNSPTELSYEWVPAEGVVCPNCMETEVRPLQSTRYTIRATDEFGCQLEESFRVDVLRDLALYIPTAFSPNGDGVNDSFRLFPGLGLDAILYFSVFNRWGSRLYYSENCATSCAWDGTYRDQLMERGIYIFSTRIRYLDGLEETISGEITLL